MSTSKGKARIALAVVAACSGTALLVLAHRSTYGLVLGGLFLAAGVLAFARRMRQPESAQIEPAYETSILAFPPEPKLGRRPLRRS